MHNDCRVCQRGFGAITETYVEKPMVALKSRANSTASCRQSCDASRDATMLVQAFEHPTHSMIEPARTIGQAPFTTSNIWLRQTLHDLHGIFPWLEPAAAAPRCITSSTKRASGCACPT